MRVEKCYFCGSPVYPGHGMQFMRNDCKIFKFCRTKCLRHFKSKHDPKKMKWTKAHRKLRGKELMYDKTLEFEKRKEEPIRYDRHLYIKTIAAMQRVDDIKKQRDSIFWRNRMRICKDNNRKAVQNELKKHVNIIENPEVKDIMLAKIEEDKKKQMRTVRKTELQKLVVEDEEDEGMVMDE